MMNAQLFVTLCLSFLTLKSVNCFLNGYQLNRYFDNLNEETKEELSALDKKFSQNLRQIKRESKPKFVYEKHANVENGQSEVHRLTDPDVNLFLKRARLQSVGEERLAPMTFNHKSGQEDTIHKVVDFSDVYFVAIVVGFSAVAIFSVAGAGYCFYVFQQHNKAAADVDYPAYGVTGPAVKENINNGNVSPSGDKKLAQSAQMYHYHHQKQQMIASEKVATSRHTSASDVDSEEENEEGDYTVYECPGLASTVEMEVKNPLFQDDITPISSPNVTNNVKDNQ